ncbi:hypothetical protein A2661_00240 [Candidatus Giovannonibacteria bacterium RIFCSPHIGHO2_01_FULL_45_24]|uniref:ABC transporter domain-containing protein n=1 Tax=Candidatus Giovannonibacteria bacterium RIFCSPLOWO2_01_FULL_46_32 TaxID=1798353 RepID=A0A1F5XGF9_9BACT|nr:MAG: hypothetical protein A2661_00240 [Candidatus Giovannonibacteria bacterium RIFCSPHIGHO2_01_FULL_45_24]OGF87008.1 MAG: hypothetical protein A3B19_01080 [Candidatus Giovannonibacteria bacterium RIFCSPLOWO2_01_FULL_46_32]
MIELKNISKIYKSGPLVGGAETEALKNISFSIKDGEFVAITGPSGSGKSTLMHIIGCLDTPSDGKYFLDQKDISELSDNELADIRREKIGFVFQAFNLLPRATVLRNVSLPLVYAGVKKAERESRAKEALLAAAFPESFWQHRSNQLSGGMMQRVAIARALVNNPSLILADEPTGNLDTKTGEIILATFQKLYSGEGRTIILITHESYVAEHAGRIISIKDGEVVSDSENSNRRIVSSAISQ